MDLRIGAKSPIYSSRATSKVADKALKADFAKMMAETKPVNQDTVEISGNPLTQRLENVHQKINEMDFTGKTSEEVYRSVVDAYEEQFGFIGNLHYLDEDAYNQVYPDRQKMIEGVVPNYRDVKNGLHYRAMGYDKMTKEEKIAAIRERIGGDSYVHKYAMLGEMERAGVITSHQNSTIAYSLYRKSEKEYCAAHGLDYIQWSMHRDEGSSGKYADSWVQKVMTWASTVDVTWLEVFDSIHENEALWDDEKDILIKELEGTSELLIGSDKV